MSQKNKGLLVNLGLYAVAFLAAAIPFFLIENMLAASAAMTATATLVLYAATCVFSDVSIYDPYWSVAPPVILLFCMIKYGLWNPNSAVLLALILLWSVRLTGNWYATYRGLRHEDWRYAAYREKLSGPLFQLVSFFGLQFVPTAVVYAGLISGLLSAREPVFQPLSLFGCAVMFASVALEWVSDRAIHRFLKEHAGERKTCDVSVWRYSRHPNYLGEISFWTGLFLYYVPLRPARWYLGLGFLTIVALFLFVSIPLMERHNLERRPDYADYQKTTSVLLLLPKRR